MKLFPFHEELSLSLSGEINEVFDYLDDFRRLSGHMERRSGMMMGSKMGIELDGAGGRTVGSRVRMRGTMLGLDLALEEVVTERERPHHKAWETVDARLFVIGQYRLGFDLEPAAGGTQVTIYIDYALPHRGPGKVLGAMLGRRYAR